jgi:uncharacterized membrane protein YkvI
VDLILIYGNEGTTGRSEKLKGVGGIPVPMHIILLVRVSLKHRFDNIGAIHKQNVSIQTDIPAILYNTIHDFLFSMFEI